MTGRTDQGPTVSRDADRQPGEPGGLQLIDVAISLAANIRLLVLGPLAAGLLALGITYMVSPVFTARTLFLPPQQQQSATASALASLGALSGLAGAAVGLKSPIDQYAALMQSTTVADRIVDQFDLMAVYDEEYRVEARKELARNVRISIGKKDGLISVEVDDEDPARAASMANAYVDELKRLSSQLALTEAQQRRTFFEGQVKQAQENLLRAEGALQASGFNPGALKAEPKAAAENYARLRAEVTAAEVRLQTLRRRMADNSTEVQQQQTHLAALRSALAKMEEATDTSSEPGYVGKYRDFKYQEALFDVFSRQYELARLDESRDGALVQVVDVATPPERKSWPKRAMTAVVTTVLTLLLVIVFVLARAVWRQAVDDPEAAKKLATLREALGRRRPA